MPRWRRRFWPERFSSTICRPRSTLYSGDSVTAAFTLGVPHPPGYPLWTLLGFLWSHLAVSFGNPAWRIGLLSVVTGALLVGAMALTMIRSTRLLLESLPWSGAVEARVQRWISITVGVSTALLFGFNRTVWYWACVPEMQALYTLLFVLMTCAFLAWAMHPHRRGFLYAALLLFALSLANSTWTDPRVIAVMAIPFGVGALAVGFDEFFEARQNAPQDGWFWSFLMRRFTVLWELCIAGTDLFSGFLLCVVLDDESRRYYHRSDLAVVVGRGCHIGRASAGHSTTCRLVEFAAHVDLRWLLAGRSGSVSLSAPVGRHQPADELGLRGHEGRVPARPHARPVREDATCWILSARFSPCRSSLLLGF